MVANDGVFFTTNGNIAGIPSGPNNRVLLGQFTTDGDFSFDVNLNVFDEGDNGAGNLQYLAFSDLSCSTLVGTMVDGTALGLVYPAPPSGPANDLCANAIALTMNDPAVTGDLTEATPDGADGSCHFGGDPTDNNIWYSFVAAGGTTRIQTTLGTNGDTQMTVFDACGGTEVACNDDDEFPGLQAGLSADCSVFIPGNTYLVSVDGYEGDLGDFTIEVTNDLDGCTDMTAANYDACATNDDGSCIPTLANDDCANAIALVMNDPAIDASNIGATIDGAAPSCSSFSADVWFSFVAAGGTTTIETDVSSVGTTITDTRYGCLRCMRWY